MTEDEDDHDEEDDLNSRVIFLIRSTQTGKFIREEIEEIRAGRHGARSTKQAIAIGLSKARRPG